MSLEPIRPEVMVEQVEGLAGDLRALTPAFDEQVRGLLTPSEWRSVDRVYLTGDGDSYHASCAAEMAFEAIAGVTCEPLSAQRFLDYALPWLPPTWMQRSLVLATSASGGTQRVVQAIERARAQGALTIAVTGTPGSQVTKAADRALIVELPERRRSPGIRTYQASLLGLLLTALRTAEMRDEPRPGEQGELRRELSALGDAVEATSRAIEGPCREAAELVASASSMAVLGSGPSYGTACFCAAKLVEAAGTLAVGQDLEEWWHVERFAYPLDMPVFVVAPPGRSHWRAAEVAAVARGLGRRVIAVAHEDDVEVGRHAHAVLPVLGEAREEFSPLLYHVFSGYVASFVAQRLGRQPFQAGRPQPARDA